MCMNVDFPEPDGPMTATNSPASSARSTPRSACTLLLAQGVGLAQAGDFDDARH